VIPVGAIVGIDGSCLGIADTSGIVDASVVHRSCADDPAESWSRDEDGHLRAALPDAYLEADADPDVGAPVNVGASISPVAPTQQWAFDSVQLVNGTGDCVDVPNGDFYDRATVQLYYCNQGDNQRWGITPLGQIQHGSFCIDVPEGLAVDGTLLQAFTCNDDVTPNQRFAFQHGRIEPLNSGKCVGAHYDAVSQRTLLEIEPCDMASESGQNQDFFMHGRLMSQGLCLDIGTPSAQAGPVALNPCAGTSEQIWSWYF
jgi:hypothetical protein